MGPDGKVQVVVSTTDKLFTDQVATALCTDPIQVHS